MFWTYAGIILGLVGIAVGIYYGRKALMGGNNSVNQSMESSPGSVQVSGNGNTTHVNNSAPSPIPELRFEIYGDGSTCTFTSKRVINRSGQGVVIEETSIGGIETTFDRNLNNMTILEELNFPPEIFTSATDDIPVSLTYRTVAGGDRFKLELVGVQEARVGDSHFNITFPGAPNINRL